MSTKYVVISIDAAANLLSELTDLVKAAREAGSDQVNISPLKSAFQLLDSAEAALDKAISEA